MKLEEVRACLERDGWPVDVLSDVTMRSRFRCGERVFPLFVHLEVGRVGGAETPPNPPSTAGRPAADQASAPGCVTFAVIPFARLPIDEAGDFMADRLLTLNREMNMAKFSVDEDGDVVLSVEYPLQDLDPSEVRDAMDVLSFYAEKYRAEVQAMAAAGVADPTRPPA